MKWIWVALLLASPAFGGEWLRANFHAHSRDTLVRDDGAETAEELHRAVRKAGFDVSVHSTHSSNNTTADAGERFRLQAAAEEALRLGQLLVTLGEELTVQKGKNHRDSVRILGSNGPGNIDHMSLVGIRELVPDQTPLAEACQRAHRDGGICLVNHPGPGPMMWEEGLWEAPENRGHIDGLEVYNGEAMAVLGFDFERRYLEATAYSRLGMKIAAVSGADTHGPESFKRSRAQLGRISPATKLLAMVLPKAVNTRPELEAATLVRAEARTLARVMEAVRARRTIAVWALPLLGVELPGLGEVHKTADVDLHIKLSRPVAELTLYKEGIAVQTWKNAAEASFREHLDKPAAYVFSVRDGGGKLLTSATWYEPR